MVQADVGDDAAAEEGRCPDAGRAVDELVGDKHVQWLDLELKTADGADRDQRAYAQRCQGPDVGAVRHFAWGVAMAKAVAADEGHRDAVELAQDDRVGRGAVGCFDLDGA